MKLVQIALFYSLFILANLTYTTTHAESVVNLPITNVKTLKIGVLAKRGTKKAFAKWQATADYLTNQIPHYQFEIVPLGFEEVDSHIANKSVDFLLTNPSIYVEMEIRYGINRITTLKNKGSIKALTVFGSVIFTRADHPSIDSLLDLSNKTHFAAVQENSLGGFQMAWLELSEIGLDPFTDFASLQFKNTHDNVVKSVLNHGADIGTVRSDTLERMANEGKISLTDFKIINPHHNRLTNFPYLLSTQLYPEWPLSKLPHIENEISQKVAIALMRMPINSMAAIQGENEGWTVPQNYQSVIELMKSLQIGPYKNFGKMTIGQFVFEHLQAFVLSFLAFVLLVWFTVHESKLRRKLSFSEEKLKNKVIEKKQLAKALAEKSELLVLELNKNTLALAHQKRIVEYNNIISLLISAVEAEDVMQKALTHLSHLSESFMGCVFLLDDKTQQLMMFACCGTDVDGHIHNKICSAAFKEVLATHKPLHLKNLTANTDFSVDLGLLKHSPKEIIALSLKAKAGIQGIQGIMVLGTLEHYSEQEITLLNYATNLISILLENAQANEKMKKISVLDALTGLYNRYYLDKRLKEEISESERNNTPLSILMIDIDLFKNINDSLGHIVGDEGLKSTATEIKRCLREQDVIFRYGGEEFLVLLPHSLGDKALNTANKIRLFIEQSSMVYDKKVTISIGITQYQSTAEETEDSFISRADKALYQAKENGRNNCVLF